MGKILDDKKAELKELLEEVKNPALAKDEKEFLESEIAELQKDIQSLEAAHEKPKQVKNKVKKSSEKVEAKKKAEPKPKVDEKQKEVKYSTMYVEEKITDENGNVIKRTAKDTYILEHHKQPSDKVVFHKVGNKWTVDCCKKRGIEFNANEIDTAIEYIIEGLDCHFQIEERKKIAQKRKKSRAKYEALSDTEKMENAIEKAAESVENRVEDIKEKGKSVSPSTAKDFVADIKKIVSSIKEGINEKSERQKFIKNLIAELQKELNEKFERTIKIGDIIPYANNTSLRKLGVQELIKKQQYKVSKYKVVNIYEDKGSDRIEIVNIKGEKIIRDKYFDDEFKEIVRLSEMYMNNEKFEDGGSVEGERYGDDEFNYRMLSRLQSECDYFLGYGGRSEKYLYGENVDSHIKEMKKIWNGFSKSKKPEWLSMEEIEQYESDMKEDTLIINDYKIRYNPMYREYQVRSIHTGDGEDFKTLKEAKEHAIKG